MKVALIDHTQNPLVTIFKAFRICYSKSKPTEINLPSEEMMLEFIKSHVSHESPLEHATFTFAIEGASRAMTHQLVRHRVASYSQQSQRYVNGSNFDFVIPPEIEKIPEAKEIFVKATQDSMEHYNKLYKILSENGRDKEQSAEDARYVFPNATDSNIIVTMNARELIHFFGERLCVHAQWEIRVLAREMAIEADKILPIFSYGNVMKCGKTCNECSLSGKGLGY